MLIMGSFLQKCSSSLPVLLSLGFDFASVFISTSPSTALSSLNESDSVLSSRKSSEVSEKVF